MCEKIVFRAGQGSLMEQLLSGMENGQKSYGFCGGRGVCGKCRVRFLTNAPLPSFADRKHLTPEQLRQGYRLACTAKPASDALVEPCFVEDFAQEILTHSHAAERSETAGGVNAAERSEAQGRTGLFCAVDLGTTTVVMQLIDDSSGACLFTHTFFNPQRSYGLDVLARISAAEAGKGALLRECILTELELGMRKIEQVGIPKQVIVSGNTTMGHLLLGYPVEGLGKAPFTPYHLGSSHFDLCGHPAIFLPGISAFVGADVAAGVYACHMAEREELSLLIDLGTNGEMVIGNREGLLCTATAAGSAFEGGILAQAAGTDVTAFVYDMLTRGILEESGLLTEPWFTNGYPAAEGILLRQQDIRNLQMAKAAICAGAELLLEYTEGWERLSCVYLAGGFGYFLDVEKAVGIGLIPAALSEKCRAVGNTSLAGAIRYGKEEMGQEQLERIIRLSRSINLAKQPEFEHRYIDAMALGRREGR